MLRSALFVAAAALLSPLTGAKQDEVDRIDRVFSAISSDQPGCAAGVGRSGSAPIFRSFGLADLESRAPITDATAFDIASVHKQFVAASVLLLVEDGQLKLADDIRTYIPEFPDYGEVITLDHLLTHTSGIRDWVVLMPFADDDADALSLILRQAALNFAPGEEWSYSNSGYVLLKEIIRRRTGMSFAEFSEQRIFRPLGLRNSTYVADPLQANEPRALAYRRDGTGWRPNMRLGRERGGGGVMTSARDLLAWNDALTTGRLSTFVSRELERPTVLNNGRVLSYARGLNVETLPGGRLVSHSGGGAGFSAWLGRFTDAGVSTVVLCNFEPVSATNLATQVSDIFLPPPPEKPSLPESPGPVVDADDRSGVYINEATGDVMRLSGGPGHLSIAGRIALKPVAHDIFAVQRRQLFYRSGDDFALHFVSPDTFTLRSMEGDVSRYRRALPWTPSAEDLRAAGGHYESAELGSALELLAQGSGVILRSERHPDRTLAFSPVAPDIYLHEPSGTVIHLLRNADGSVQGFRHDHPGLRNVFFVRKGSQSLGSLLPEHAHNAAKLPARSAAGADPNLAGLAGDYVMPTGVSVSVTALADQLYAQPQGKDRLRLRPRSGLVFDVDGASPPTTLTFSLDNEGRPNAIVMEADGRRMTLRRRQ